MKNYSIYQFFVDSNHKERNVLVGFAEAESEQDAKNNYLLQKYPDDSSKRNFIMNYLTARFCKQEDLVKPELLEAIKKHKAELGVWA